MAACYLTACETVSNSLSLFPAEKHFSLTTSVLKYSVSLWPFHSACVAWTTAVTHDANALKTQVFMVNNRHRTQGKLVECAI